MSTDENDLETILENINQRAAKAQGRALIITLIPIIIGIALIAVTWQQVGKASAELDKAEESLSSANQSLTEAEKKNSELQNSLTESASKLETLQSQVKELENKINSYNTDIKSLEAERELLEAEKRQLVDSVTSLNAQVEESGVLRNKFFEGDVLVILKDMSGDYPAQTELLEEILNRQSPDSGTTWLAGGVGPLEFDSPGFAAFLLTEKGLVSGKPEDLHYNLLNSLHSINTPENGDIVFYKGGYTMFFFQDPYTQENFVIGMTTFGIVAMKYDFAPLIGIGDVIYP